MSTKNLFQKKLTSLLITDFMKHGKYSLQELFTNRNIEQIIIPEIQRDYVWDEKNVQQLLVSIIGDYKKFEGFKVNERIEDKEIQELFEQFVKKEKHSSNIGFIYAYDDSEYAGKYFLIDGQQRLTTLFLTLLVLHKMCGKEKQFKEKYFVNEGAKLDYKVREASHEFLCKFILHILDQSDFNVKDVEQQHWYYPEYRDDVTIQKLKANYYTIQSFIQQRISNAQSFLDYLNHYVAFWYFDTNISEQGEELYIYMNARGKQMQANENIKAQLLHKLSTDQFAQDDELRQLSKEQLKNHWGRKWEEWQNFFFRNRIKNENADNGFNEFLRWVYLAEMAKKQNWDIIKKMIGEKDNEEKEDIHELDASNFDINTINRYFSSVQRIFKDDNEWIRDRWIEKQWLGPSRPLKKITLFVLLPALMIDTGQKDMSDEELKRFIRFFYNLTRISTVSKAATQNLLNALKLSKLIVDENISDIADIIQFKISDDSLETRTVSKALLSEEEYFKLRLFKTYDKARQQIEESFWKAEDHKINSGRIEHLLQLSFYKGLAEDFSLEAQFFQNADNTQFDLNTFNQITKSYCTLIPEDGSISSRLRGNFLNTGLYVQKGGNEHWDGRIDYVGDEKINSNSSFLQFVLEIGNDNRDSFLNKKEKSFIKRSATLLNSLSEKKEQLYVYFILLNNKQKWTWNRPKINFGFRQEDANSGLPHNTDFHFYGYQLKVGIHNEVLSSDLLKEYNQQELFNELINWSNQ
jgi:hypothetical protein